MRFASFFYLLLPPIAGIDSRRSSLHAPFCPIAPPLRGLICCFYPFMVIKPLLPPIAGIDTTQSVCLSVSYSYCPPSRGLIIVHDFCKLGQRLLPPIAGIDTFCRCRHRSDMPIAPIAGIDTPCRERSAAQRRRPFHTPPSTFHTPSLRSPPHFPFR